MKRTPYSALLLLAVLLSGCGSSSPKHLSAAAAERAGTQAAHTLEAKWTLCLELQSQLQRFTTAVKAAESSPASPTVEASAVEATNKLRSNLLSIVASAPTSKRPIGERWATALQEYAHALTLLGEGHATEALVQLGAIDHKFSELPSLPALCS